MPTRRAFLASGIASGLVSALPVMGQAAHAPSMFDPTPVTFSPDYETGQIVILPRSYFLYHVTAPGQAMRYGIAVARVGLGFTGTAVIGRKVEWPSWRPTPEMIERDAPYAKFKGNNDRMPGGPNNPLGARALYLYQDGKDTYIRIHGTTHPESIGHNASSGCFRMVNKNVIALYDKVPTGTRVTVL